MAWPPGWNLNAAIQGANGASPLTPNRRLNVLEDWRENYVIPWGQLADAQFQNLQNWQMRHETRIDNLEGHRNAIDKQLRFWLSRIPGVQNRIYTVERRMGRIERQCRKNGKAVNNFDKKMNQVIDGIEKPPEKLGQQRGGLGGEFGGGGYANGQIVFQQGFINTIPQQHQFSPLALSPSRTQSLSESSELSSLSESSELSSTSSSSQSSSAGSTPSRSTRSTRTPPPLAPAPAPAPPCGCRVHHPACIHIKPSRRGSRRRW